MYNIRRVRATRFPPEAVIEVRAFLIAYQGLAPRPLFKNDNAQPRVEARIGEQLALQHGERGAAALRAS